MKCIVCAVLIFFLPLFANAQSNYKPGYKVTLSGDTVKGNIDYREWAKNPSGFYFKLTPDGVAEEQTTDKVLAFGINQTEFYERHTVWISQDPTVSIKLVGLDTTKIRQTVFLKLLSAGDKVNLYQYVDEIKERYYIKEANAEPKELVYRSYRDVDYSTLITSTFYRAQLNQLAIKNHVKSAQKKITTARYAASDLVKIVDILNGSSVGYSNSSNVGTRFYGGIGINYASLDVSGYKAFTDEATTIKNTPFPIIQAGIDVFANKNIKRVAFRAEISYTQNTHDITTPLSRLHNVTGTAQLKYTQKIIAVSPQILFAAYNANALKVYFVAGMTWNFMSYGKYGYKSTYTDPYYNDESPNEPPFVKSGISFIGKVNVSFKKFEIFGGMAPRMIYTKFNGYSFSNRTFQAGVNWYLNK